MASQEVRGYWLQSGTEGNSERELALGDMQTVPQNLTEQILRRQRPTNDHWKNSSGLMCLMPVVKLFPYNSLMESKK